MKSLKYYLAALGTAVMATAVIACGGFGERVNPVAPAIASGRPDLIAYAIEGSYTIIQKQARVLAEDPAVPMAVKQVFADVAARANPILDKIKPLALEATGLREHLMEVAEGEDPDAQAQERLRIVLADLDRLVTEVSPMVSELVDAVAAAVGGAP